MSVASLMFIVVVVMPLVLLVIDLVSRKAPAPSAPPARNAVRR
jgi:hypothetical protein